MRHRITCFIGCTFYLLLACPPAVRCQELPSKQSLLTNAVTGIEVPSVGWVEFRAPALSGERPDNAEPLAKLSSAEKLSILERLADGFGWDRFSRDSLATPVIIEMQELTSTTGQRSGYLAYSAFVAYADLDRLRDRNLMEATFGPQGDAEADNKVAFEKLSPADLGMADNQAAGINDEEFPAAALMRLPLFNRIVIEGVVALQQTNRDDQIRLTWHMLPRFKEEALAQTADALPKPESEESNRLQNTWVKLVANNVGRLEPSSPTPYEGLGGYTAVTATGLVPNQLLIETCLVIHEPYEWFSGSKFLRARLLVSLQESAKSFRRKLSKLE